MLAALVPDTLILTGAYGSGKTECALALALACATAGPVTLVDLDCVTPYFRAQDCRAALEAQGVTLVAPVARVAQLDTPAVPPAAADAMRHPRGHTIVDLGGDPVGATVIAQFAPRLPHAALWAVVNFSRPTTPTPTEAARWLHDVVAATRLPLGGLISNTHLGPETTAEDLVAGLAAAEVLGALLGVPVRLQAAPAGVPTPAGPPVLAITPQLHRPWER